MNTEEWEYYRELERQVVTLQTQLGRLQESINHLQRINFMIFSAIILEAVVLLTGGQ